MSLEARLATLEQQYARLQAHQDVWNVITRYARAIDEHQQDDLEAIFTEDAELLSLPWNQQPVAGKAVVLKAFRNYQRAFHHPRRFITNEQIHIHDDGTATGYANWFVVQSREGQSYCGWGCYEWTFRRDEGTWKISKMVIRLDCMTTLEYGWGMLEERVLPFPPRPQH